jgi:glycerol-3-phosphate acyltransferase PlsY
MPDFLSLIVVAITAYLLGSIPTGVLLARVFGWDDPRTHGSQHTGALNVSRRAGKAALVIVLVVDFLKGLGAVLLAPAIPLAGGAAVAGHCWPVWLDFRGGMGLAAGVGAVVVYALPAVIFAVVALVIIRFLIVRHTPRAVIIASGLTLLAAWPMGFPLHVFALVAAITLLIGARHTIDWNRKYD